jgi:hypothetical protein
MPALNRFSAAPIPPQVHRVLDYPHAAVLIAGPLVLNNYCGRPEFSVLGVRRAIGRRPCIV